MSTATLGKNTLSKRGLLWRIAPVAMIPCHTEPSTLHSAPRRRTVSYRVSAHFELGFRSSLCQRAGDDAAGDEPLVSLASGLGLSNFCDAEDAFTQPAPCKRGSISGLPVTRDLGRNSRSSDSRSLSLLSRLWLASGIAAQNYEDTRTVTDRAAEITQGQCA